MQFLAIVFLSIAVAVIYGTVHDQITARICVEYFTIWHPPIFGTEDPTLLGLGWGFIATWWVGFFLGVPLACLARFGRAPKIDAKWLIRPMAILMAVNYACATLAGIVGYWMGTQGLRMPNDWLAENIPLEKHPAFFADAFAHETSYTIGFLGGLFLMGYVWRQRLILAGKLKTR